VIFKKEKGQEGRKNRKIFVATRSVHTQESQRAGNFDEASMITVLDYSSAEVARQDSVIPVVHIPRYPRLLRVTSIHIAILHAPIQIRNGDVEC
jgi:hypothetical protein